jgi:hypothetical protein
MRGLLLIRAEAAPGHSRNVSVGQQQVYPAQVHIETSFNSAMPYRDYTIQSTKVSVQSSELGPPTPPPRAGVSPL